LLTSSYAHSSWQASKSSDEVVHAADMTEKQWGIVMRNTGVLNGQHATLGDGQKIESAQRAYYTAFGLKPRTIPSYDITFEQETQEETDEKHDKEFARPTVC
jgi:hypothetical protein